MCSRASPIPGSSANVHRRIIWQQDDAVALLRPTLIGEVRLPGATGVDVSFPQASRAKRGGGQSTVSWDAMSAEERYQAEPQDETSAEALYEERWALTLLDAAMARLGAELAAAGRERIFVELKGQIWGGAGVLSYSELSGRLEMSEGALKVTVHRLRQRFRELLREEVVHTVADAAEINDELRHLVGVVRRSGL
jgi:hypothetical protein